MERSGGAPDEKARRVGHDPTRDVPASLDVENTRVEGTKTSRLLEREPHLAELGALVERAYAGRGGGVAAVVAPAGLGKTSLLRALCEQAQDAGMGVVWARGGELERDFAFGVVRQLFEPAVSALSPAELADAFAGAASLTAPLLGRERSRERRMSSLFPLSADSPFPLLHAFYWLTANLAAQRPLLAVVDDLHWADEQSLRWLLYLARRLEELPMLVVVSLRSGESGSSELLDQLLAEAAVALLRLEPLSEAAVGALVAEAFGEEPDAAFTRACYMVSGGNPFLFAELALALVARGVTPAADAVSAVQVARPGGLQRSIVSRLGRLSAHAGALANAVAVLGDDAELRHASALAGLDHAAALSATEELVRAGILGPSMLLSFAHPLVRTAVYSAIAPTPRADDHGRAARLLAADGESTERAASHLMHAHAIGDPDAVVILWTAAAEARERGAPEIAARYLERALREPCPPELRPALLNELGVSEARTGQDAAIAHLRASLALSSEPVQRAARALDLANALLGSGSPNEAYDLLERTIADLAGGDRELRLQLEAQLLTVGQIELSLTGRARMRFGQLGEIAGDTPGERLVLGALALERRLAGALERDVRELAGRALAGGGLVVEQPPDSPIFYHAVGALGLDASTEELLARACADARGRGSLLGQAIASAVRAVLLRSGDDIRELESEAANALRIGREVGWRLGLPLAVAALLSALIEQGRLDAAEDTLHEAQVPAELPAQLYYGFLLYERGRLRSAETRPAEALTDFEELGRREAALGYTLHAVLWRAAAAPECVALGDQQQGRALAEEAVQLARGRGRRSIGIALRSLALVHPERRIGLLEQAIAALDGSRARVEHARALVDLGGALRRAGRRAESRAPLRAGLGLAHDSGADALAQRARLELAAAGTRQRSVPRAGVDTMTASERRVAHLAASGLSNPEIAQTLYVTVKTVETHLHRTYQKLGITSRTQLAQALEG